MSRTFRSHAKSRMSAVKLLNSLSQQGRFPISRGVRLPIALARRRRDRPGCPVARSRSTIGRAEPPPPAAAPPADLISPAAHFRYDAFGEVQELDVTMGAP